MRKIVFWAFVVAIVPALALVGTVRGQGTPPPPPPPPGTATPTVTPTPTATPTATSTATPVPLTIRLQLAHGNVSPRAKQKVTVVTLPGASVSIVVTFPNGNKKTHDGTANASGNLSWSFTQPGSRITHASRTAKVSAQVSDASGQTKSSTKRYTISFANLDVAVSPRAQARGKAVSIWVHSGAFLPVQLFLRYHNGASVYLRLNRSGRDGWTYLQYKVPTNAPKGRVTVKGYAAHSPSPYSGETSFRVR